MHNSRTVSLVFCKVIVTKFPSQLHLLSDISVNMMESKFHSLTNMNHGQEHEALDLDEQGGLNPSSNS